MYGGSMLDGLRILVVEDIPSIRSLIARLLERLGCSDVYAVGNIADAFTYLDTLGFDAVLLDYELEHENGLTLVRRLRRDKNWAMASGEWVARRQNGNGNGLRYVRI